MRSAGFPLAFSNSWIMLQLSLQLSALDTKWTNHWPVLCCITLTQHVHVQLYRSKEKRKGSPTGISIDCSPRSHGGLRAFGLVANQYVVMAAKAPMPMSVLVGKLRTYCRRSSSSGIRSCLRTSWACIVVLHWPCRETQTQSLDTLISQHVGLLSFSSDSSETWAHVLFPLTSMRMWWCSRM